MGHHSQIPMTKQSDLQRALESEADKLRAMIESEAGPTLRYPHGKLTEHDEGEIQIKIGGDPQTQRVLIDFGKPTAWIGFTPQQARELAQSLIAKADAVQGISV